MNRLLAVIAFSFIMMHYCSGNESGQSQAGAARNVTFVHEFGDHPQNSDYLLARIDFIAVNDKGDVFVSDESRIKVFDTNGKEKMIFGEPGQGPEEFEWGPVIRMGPNGHLAAMGSHIVKMISPNGDFFAQINTNDTKMFSEFTNKLGLHEILMESVVCMNAGKYLIDATGYESERTPVNDAPNTSSLLFFMEGNRTALCVNYPEKFTISYTGYGGRNVKARHEYLGKLYYDIVDENRVVYTHTGYDKQAGEQGYSFTLHVYDSETEETHGITLPYTPVAIPDSVIKKGLSPRGYSFIDQSFRPFADAMRERLRAVKYLPPVRDIIADGKTVFVITYQRDYPDRYPAFTVHIKTGDTGPVVVFPEPPDAIRNGYAYSKSTDKAGFPVVRKYRIDPAVYGK